jgi:hypothetical protein
MARKEYIPEDREKETGVRKGPDTSRSVPGLELHGDPTTNYPEIDGDDGMDESPPEAEPPCG